MHLIILEKASFVLCCELWTENFNSLLALVKEYIIHLLEAKKVNLYGEPWGFKGWHCGWGADKR